MTTTQAVSDTDVAYPVTGGSIYFNKETGTVTGCDKTVTAADIPSEIDGVAVTSIGYYYNAVLWAVENGITKGTSATTFEPDATCTRGQIVTFLYRDIVE